MKFLVYFSIYFLIVTITLPLLMIDRESYYLIPFVLSDYYPFYWYYIWTFIAFYMFFSGKRKSLGRYVGIHNGVVLEKKNKSDDGKNHCIIKTTAFNARVSEKVFNAIKVNDVLARKNKYTCFNKRLNFGTFKEQTIASKIKSDYLPEYPKPQPDFSLERVISLDDSFKDESLWNQEIIKFISKNKDTSMNIIMVILEHDRDHEFLDNLSNNIINYWDSGHHKDLMFFISFKDNKVHYVKLFSHQSNDSFNKEIENKLKNLDNVNPELFFNTIENDIVNDFYPAKTESDERYSDHIKMTLKEHIDAIFKLMIIIAITLFIVYMFHKHPFVMIIIIEVIKFVFYIAQSAA